MRTKAIGLSLVLLSTFALAEVPTAAELDLVRRIDSGWRSRDRDIDAKVLMEESFHALPSADLIALGDLSRERLLAVLHTLKSELDINRGVAENLIKIQAISNLCGLRQCINEYGRDWVSGLPGPTLDALVADFASVPKEQARLEREFNYVRYEKIRLFERYALENDWYNLRVAAAFYTLGMHKDRRSVYHMFSRGTKNRAFYVASGQTQIYNMIKNLRFTEREIRFLQEHPVYKNIDPGFWDFLRNWRFTGSIRAVPEGTVLFANQPMMEVIAPPIDQHILEVLMLPIGNDAGKVATKTARVGLAMDGRDFVEGGTRRSGNGRVSALFAVAAGALGTSNTHIARLFEDEVVPYGSMPHAWVDHFTTELDAFIAYLRLYPDSSVIGDTHDILQGVRNAVLAGAAGLREDSLLPEKNLEMTVKTVRYLLKKFGHDPVKLGISNRLDEYELRKHPAHRTPFQWGLVGSEIAAPSDAAGLNMVYKLARTERLIDGEWVGEDRAKTSSGKPGIPGTAEVYRRTGIDGMYAGDVVGARDEVLEGDVRPLMIQGMLDGEIVAPEESLATIANRTRTQLAKFSKEVLDPESQPGVYPVEQSKVMRARMNRIKASLTRDRRMKIGIFVGDFDPPSDLEMTVIPMAKEFFEYEEMILIPRKRLEQQTIFPLPYRVAALRQAFADEEGIDVDNSEIEACWSGLQNRIEKLRAERGWSADANIQIFTSVSSLGRFASQPDAASMAQYSWAVGQTSPEMTELPFLRQLGFEPVQGSLHHFNHSSSPTTVRSIDFKVGALAEPGAEQRFAQVDTIFHQVDAMETFWESMHGLTAGALAVPGSMDITGKVASLAELGRDSTRVKSIASIDFHRELELRDPKRWNPEMAVFGAHGMADRTGHQGSGRIREVRDVFPINRQLRIPGFRERRGTTPEQDVLEETPFLLENHAVAIADPDVELIIEKNGSRTENVHGENIQVEAYDWGINRHAVEVVNRLHKATRVVVYGVATDFCVRAAALRYARMGFEVWLVKDAVAGIFPDSLGAEHISQAFNIKTAEAEMKAAGVKFVTTAKVVKEYAGSRKGCAADLKAAAN